MMTVITDRPLSNAIMKKIRDGKCELIVAGRSRLEPGGANNY